MYPIHPAERQRRAEHNSQVKREITQMLKDRNEQAEIERIKKDTWFLTVMSVTTAILILLLVRF